MGEASRLRVLGATFFAMFCVAACDGGSETDGKAGASGSGGARADDHVFDPEHVLEIDVEIAASDLEVMVGEGRSINQVFSGCLPQDFEFSYFPATVTVDGTKLDNVGVRKKGFLGSLSTLRPSLKLDFGQFAPEQRYRGHQRLTLNNDRQDPSHTHQCMSYGLFRAAGIPAPRCNLARVTLNGEELGIFSNVEGVKAPFLEDHFGTAEGSLYEGQLADFREGFLENFEPKNDAAANDSSDLMAMQEALEAPDEELLAALEPLMDLEEFITFWAVESLSGHWDGYSGDLNNFFLYRDPDTGFHFIPWGTDGAYQLHGFHPAGEVPASVLADGYLAYRLYNYDETRQRYRARLTELLEQFWDEEALLAEVDRWAALSGSAVDVAALDAQRDFITHRRAAVEAELTGAAPPWPYEPRPVAACGNQGELVSLAFDTTWGSLSELEVGGVVSADWGGIDNVPTFDLFLSKAGPDDTGAGEAGIRLVGAQLDGSWVALNLFLPLAQFAPGEYPLHGFETYGVVASGTDPTGQQNTLLGFVGEGRVVLEEAGTEEGDAVKGMVEGRFLESGGAFMQ